MEALQNRRVWIGGAALFAVVVIAASWFMLIHPKLAQASNLRDETASTQLSNVILQHKNAALKQKSDNLPKYRASLIKALEALPIDSGLPAFTRQVSVQAAATRVSLTSVTVSGITAASGSATTDPAAAATPAPSSSVSAPSPSTGSTVPAATPTAATGATPGTVYAVQVSLITVGNLAHQAAFLNALQYQGPRRALVTSAQFGTTGANQTGSIDNNSTLTTQVTVFSAPETPAQLAALKRLLTGSTTN